MTDTSLRGISDTPVLLTINEASEVLRISRWKLYTLINSGDLDTVRIGRRRFVPADAITKLIDKLREETIW
jgi:excisionase family DNA binding protein